MAFWPCVALPRVLGTACKWACCRGSGGLSVPLLCRSTFLPQPAGVSVSTHHSAYAATAAPPTHQAGEENGKRAWWGSLHVEGSFLMAAVGPRWHRCAVDNPFKAACPGHTVAISVQKAPPLDCRSSFAATGWVKWSCSPGLGRARSSELQVLCFVFCRFASGTQTKGAKT